MVKTERVLFTPGDQVTVGLSPHGHVMIAFEPHPDYGAQPGLWLGMELSIEQARGIAQELLRKAAALEDGQKP